MKIAAALFAVVVVCSGQALPPGSRNAKCRNPDCTEAISVVRALQSYNWPGERVVMNPLSFFVPFF